MVFQPRAWRLRVRHSPQVSFYSRAERVNPSGFTRSECAVSVLGLRAAKAEMASLGLWPGVGKA